MKSAIDEEGLTQALVWYPYLKIDHSKTTLGISSVKRTTERTKAYGLVLAVLFNPMHSYIALLSILLTGPCPASVCVCVCLC
jgi:hypothetical protein